MSARRERPPSGKVIRSEPPTSGRRAATPGPISNAQYETEKAILSGRAATPQIEKRAAIANLSSRRPATAGTDRSPNFFTASGDFVLPKAEKVRVRLYFVYILKIDF